MKAYIDKDSAQYFAFNIWNMESAKAVIDAAAKMKKNVILQTSTKAFLQMDKEEMRFFVTSYGKKNAISAYLHLDHCKSIEMIEEAVSAGWDSVMIDASELSLEENIRLTNEVCAMAGKSGIPVEAEIGQIAGVEEDIAVKEAGVAKLEDVQRFINETKVNMLAVAIGTAHGLYKGVPRLHYGLLEQTAKITDIPLVIHGGTGLTDDMFCRLLSYYNVKKINISTDVKLSYRQGIENSIQKGYMEKDGFNPLKVAKEIHDSIMGMAIGKLRLLNEGMVQ